MENEGDKEEFDDVFQDVLIKTPNVISKKPPRYSVLSCKEANGKRFSSSYIQPSIKSSSSNCVIRSASFNVDETKSTKKRKETTESRRYIPLGVATQSVNSSLGCVTIYIKLIIKIIN